MNRFVTKINEDSNLKNVSIVLEKCDIQQDVQTTTTYSKSMNIRILQLNLGRSGVVTNEVRQLVTQKRLDILLL